MDKQVFINGDLNDFYGFAPDPMPLRNQRWIDLLVKEYGKITDGMQIWMFYMPQKEISRDTVLIYPGTVNVTKDGDYEIVAREEDMKWLSELQEFGDYSIEDIIGNEWYQLIKEKYPERLKG